MTKLSTRPRLTSRLLRLALLLSCASVFAAQAQAPAWELAVSSVNQTNSYTSQMIVTSSAADAYGHVFLTGYFTDTVLLGSTQLVSAGGLDIFVAKWDGTAQAFTWAIRGGGPGHDQGNGIAVSGHQVYVTGGFGEPGGSIAGQSLTMLTAATIAGQSLTAQGVGGDMFVAKYIDTSTGHTPATSSVANGWATSGGGLNYDAGKGIAVSGPGVYVTGEFAGGSYNARIAGQALAGTGDNSDMFVAKYIDTSTGHTPATSSVANGWATSGGGLGSDSGMGITVSGPGVYVTGTSTDVNRFNTVRIAGQALTASGRQDMFVAKYIDTSTGNTPATSSFADGWATVSQGAANFVSGLAVAVQGQGVYVAGSFASILNRTGATVSIAGQTLSSVGGGADMFVAKYIDTSTGNTPATSSVANGWVTRGGGSGDDAAISIAVSGNNIFVTGHTNSHPGFNVTIAGQSLANGNSIGGYDVFVAKYLDTSTGTTPATSSFANGWASSSSGNGYDRCNSVVVSGQQVYALGYITAPATFGTIPLSSTGGRTGVLARLTDLTLPLLPPVLAATTGVTLYPNPTREYFTLALPPRAGSLATPATAVLVNALGQVVSTRALVWPTDGATAPYSTAGLAAGVYALRLQAGAEAATLRLVVE